MNDESKMQLALDLMWSHGMSDDTIQLVIKLLLDTFTERVQKKIKELAEEKCSSKTTSPDHSSTQ